MTRTAFDPPAGFVSEDTVFSSPGRWRSGSLIRFYDGQWQVSGGWERLASSGLMGVCRWVFGWSDFSDVLNVAFGNHNGLQVWQGSDLIEITPYVLPTTLGANPVSVTNDSAAVTIHAAAHGLSSGTLVTLTGATNVGRLSLNGDFSVTVVDADNLSVAAASNATVAKTLAVAPLSVTAGSPLVTVSEPGHNISAGTSVTISGAAAVGGITPNGTFPITVVDADHYRFTFTSNATSTASGGGASVVATVPTAGGGSAVLLAPHVNYPAGQIDGTGGTGYGGGAYGVGAYSEPTTDDYFPRTWSGGAFGQALIANPRKQPIFVWENDTSSRAVALANAPQQVVYTLCLPQRQIMAFGCNEEVSGDFDPLCIRWSDIENPTVWASASDNNAGEYVLEGGGRIVGAAVVGNYVACWTDVSLYLGTYVGDPGETWRFELVGRNCGLVGPNAWALSGQTLVWISPDAQFWNYTLGGAAEALDCPIRKDFADNIANGQQDKIVGATTAQFKEIRWFYPDGRDGYENSRDITLSDEGWWNGELARTAFVDAGPHISPIGCSPPSSADNSANANLFRWSEDFSNSVWGTQCAVTPNVRIAPDGTITADLVSDDSAGAMDALTQDVAIPDDFSTYGLSIFYEPGTTAAFSPRLSFLDGSSPLAYGCDLDPNTGVISNSTFAAAAVTDYGNGWSRFVGLGSNNSSGNSRAQGSFIIDSSASSAVTNIYPWGAQLRPGADQSTYTPTQATASPASLTLQGMAYWHERGISADGAPIAGFIESADFYLDDAEAALLVNGVWPDFKSQLCPVDMYLYTRNYPQAVERAKGPFQLLPGASKKSFRVSGRVVRLRFEFNSTTASVRSGRLEFDTEAIGGR